MEKREFWSWFFMIIMASIATIVATLFFVNPAFAADLDNTAVSGSNSVSVSDAKSLAVQGNGNSQGVTFNTTTSDTLRTAPTVYAPGINNTANCRIALSAGVSVIGWGVAAGGSVVDENCVLLETSRILYSIEQKAAAARLLCFSENPRVKEALGDAVCNPSPVAAPLPVVQTVTVKEVIERVVVVPARDCKPEVIPPMYPKRPSKPPVKHTC